MEDREILELYLARNKRAFTESEIKYGLSCMQIALHILAGDRDAELCVRDTYLRAWESIPPARPAHMGAYLQKLTRSLAIDRYFASHDVKRGYHLFATVLDELGECKPLHTSGFSGGFDPDTEAVRAGECVTRFLRKLGGESRDIFLCRYFYAESLGEIARRFGLNENRVKSHLGKTCGKLAKFLEHESQKAWYPDPETLARGLNYVDDTLVLAAHGRAKKAKRLIPWVAAACVVAVVAVSFPYLRTLINTDLTLRGPDWNKDKNEIGDAEIPDKPDADSILKPDVPATIANSTVTLTRVTETTATLTLVKTTDEPLYAAVYDRMGDALACTDPDYKVDGVTIRAGRIKVYTDGAAEPATELPTAPGTYTLVVDFASIRNGTYPMEDYMGILAYIGKDGAPVTVFFSLEITDTEQNTDPGIGKETVSETGDEADGDNTAA